MPIATRSDIIDLSSEKKTEELANKIIKKLKPGDIVFLYGEIGVGKTTFIKYLINELQKRNKLKLTEVTSPTFSLLNEYQINEIKVNSINFFGLSLIICGHSITVIVVELSANKSKFFNSFADFNLNKS